MLEKITNRDENQYITAQQLPAQVQSMGIKKLATRIIEYT